LSRRLPIVGQLEKVSSVAAASVATVFVDARPAITVLGARVDVGAERLVAQLSAAAEHAGRTARVERSTDVPSEARLLVIVGSHVPRSLRDPVASQLWNRADVLLAEPSEIVARALIAAV